MSEFLSRVDAQRQLLKVVNEKSWGKEELFALTNKAITRWSSLNNIDSSSQLVQLLNAATSRLFVMANHSDDPIAGEYQLTYQEVVAIEAELRKALRN